MAPLTHADVKRDAERNAERNAKRNAKRNATGKASRVPNVLRPSTSTMQRPSATTLVTGALAGAAAAALVVAVAKATAQASASRTNRTKAAVRAPNVAAKRMTQAPQMHIEQAMGVAPNLKAPAPPMHIEQAMGVAPNLKAPAPLGVGEYEESGRQLRQYTAQRLQKYKNSVSPYLKSASTSPYWQTVQPLVTAAWTFL